MEGGLPKDDKTTLRDLRASPVHELAPGTVLAGRYRIVGPAGAGGMGAIYEAEQIELRRRVAIKLVLQKEGDSFERLRQEALGASSVQSPHVVSVIDFHWEEGEPPFLVMELLEGRSLEELMADEGALPFGRACRLACELLEGLAAAHKVGLVHRDVKPANVWLVPSMSGELAKLVDFGLVKSLDDAIGLTARSGRLLGTRAYLAPEQINRLPTDPRSDLHAVGVVLWEMIAGRRVWESDGPAVFAEILTRRPEDLGAVVPAVPRGLAEAVGRALAKDAEGRFRDAAEMYAAIAPYADGRSSGMPNEPIEPVAPTVGPGGPSTLASAKDADRPAQAPVTPVMGGADRPPPVARTLLSAVAPAGTAMVPTLRSQGDAPADATVKLVAGAGLGPRPTPLMLASPTAPSARPPPQAPAAAWAPPAAWPPPSAPRFEPAARAAPARSWIVLLVVVAAVLSVAAGLLAWVLRAGAHGLQQAPSEPVVVVDAGGAFDFPPFPSIEVPVVPPPPVVVPVTPKPPSPPGPRKPTSAQPDIFDQRL